MPEPPKVGDDERSDDEERDALRLVLAPRRKDTVVEDVGEHQHGKVERRQLYTPSQVTHTHRGETSTNVVVEIGDPTHDEERRYDRRVSRQDDQGIACTVMQNTAIERDLADVQKVCPSI